MRLLPLVSSVCGMKIPKSDLKLPKGFKVPNVKQFKEDVERLSEDIAEGFMEQVIDNIEDNKYGYALAPSTIKKKGSDTPFINTHQLVDAIYREDTMVSVEDSPRTDTSITNLALAMIQEYGTKDKHIPARPVWRNTFEEYREDARKQVLDFLKMYKFKSKGKKKK